LELFHLMHTYTHNMCLDECQVAISQIKVYTRNQPIASPGPADVSAGMQASISATSAKVLELFSLKK